MVNKRRMHLMPILKKNSEIVNLHNMDLDLSES